ncbi:hypothetical protein HELRODRAFT_80653 [Helobdella robusta]|uniref:EF-hand domain-containing protein n=1 Tax=Helobdella robusta TaxID=6412 RepID=T1G435_HELRO|nr:hypothetical protein HELRODRAFT_80653 [Helobdella robusta]ESO03159.1 hypothetical protein HELRODRAFT_80653 [Helobdella robusta]
MVFILVIFCKFLKQKDCPNGQLTREKFLEVYSSFFPQGEADKFCEHVFRTFDADNSGKIDFKKARKSTRLIFTTNDFNITKKANLVSRIIDKNEHGGLELVMQSKCIQAIFKMVGPSLSLNDPSDTPDRRTKEIFEKMDENGDGVLSKEEFVKGCMADEFLYQMLTADTSGSQP